MLTYPDINPVAIALGPVKIYWYGLMYLLAFAMGWWLGRLRAERFGWTKEQMDDFVFYVALGVVLGGRLGYVLFYDLGQYVANPAALLKVWQGGMSFHGGLIGVLIAAWLFARKYGIGFFQVADFVAPLIPPGLAAGRLGNFINGELWGKPTDLPWGMVFPDPRAGDLARHPSQLYQLALEGIVLFAILWIFTAKPRPAMAASGLFLVGYGIFRFAVEFVRNPDPQIGYLAFGWVTMGQVLSAPMILLGAGFLWWGYRNRDRDHSHGK